MKKQAGRKTPIEGRERPKGLPRTIHKCEGRWFGNAELSLEGIGIRIIYFGINEHVGHGRFPSHAHPFAELFYTLAGKGWTTLGEKRVQGLPGHLFVARPGLAHGSEWDAPKDQPWRAVIIQFDIEIDPRRFQMSGDLSSARQMAPFYAYFFNRREHGIRLAHPARALAGQTCEAALELMRQSPEAGLTAVLNIFLTLAALASDRVSAGLDNGRGLVIPLGRKEQQLMLARARMKREDDPGVSIATLAEQVGMSEYHFIREFHRYFGISPQKFRQAQRMERAGKLLAQTDEPIYAIAERIGYADPGAFSKSFRKHFGVSPRSYRENWNRV